MRRKDAEGAAGSPSGERRSRPNAADGAATPRGPGHRGRDRRSGIAMTPQQVAARHAPPFFKGPRWSLICLGLVLVLAVALLGVGFSRPSGRIVPRVSAYRQTGVFSYSAAVKTPTEVYPSGEVTTGQPIYPESREHRHLAFCLSIRVVATASRQGHHRTEGWSCPRPTPGRSSRRLRAAVPFEGDSSSLVSTVALSGLYGLINTVSADSGIVGATYSADLQPVVPERRDCWWQIDSRNIRAGASF